MRKWLALGVPVPFFAMMWMACNGDSGGTSDAAGDVTTKDAGADKKILPDVAQPDVGPGCVPATTIDTTQVTWVPPITPNPNACSDAQVQGYYNACFSSTSSSTTCNAFQSNAANATCLGCLVSTAGSSTSYGGLILYGKVYWANQGGCISILTGDTSATSCGAKQEAVLVCDELACSNNCPVTDSTSLQAYQACTGTANSGVCKPYVDAVCDLADSGADGAAAAQTDCLDPTSFQAYVTSMAAVFCGDYTGDAGTPTDASADAPDGD